MSVYRRNAAIVHRDVKPGNVLQRMSAEWTRARRRWLLWRGGTWRSRFVRCSLCLGPLACSGVTNSIRRQMPNAHHLHNECEPRRSLRTFRKIVEGERVSETELKRALDMHKHWRNMMSAFPEFTPASGEARRKLLEHFGCEIPPGEYRTVNELRAALGWPSLPPEPRAGDGSDDPWNPPYDYEERAP